MRSANPMRPPTPPADLSRREEEGGRGGERREGGGRREESTKREREESARREEGGGGRREEGGGVMLSNLMPCFKCSNKECSLAGGWLNTRIFGCNKCGGDMLVKKTKKGGFFVGCAQYPNCKHSAFLPDCISEVRQHIFYLKN